MTAPSRSSSTSNLPTVEHRPESQLRLAPHVHACQVGSHVVLLDLRRDAYIGIQNASLDTLLTTIASAQQGQRSLETPESETPTTLIAQLLHNGLLDYGDIRARSSYSVSVPAPRVSITDGYVLSDRKARFSYVPEILSACVRVELKLTFRSLEQIILSIRSRRQRCANRLNISSTSDLDVTCERVATYERLRPFVFTSRHKCLRNSLSLLEFLSTHGHFPTLVFGVKIQPFGAHCWVQDGEVLLNDTPEMVRTFVPILAA